MKYEIVSTGLCKAGIHMAMLNLEKIVNEKIRELSNVQVIGSPQITTVTNTAFVVHQAITYDE